jgi:hypothetical protein
MEVFQFDITKRPGRIVIAIHASSFGGHGFKSPQSFKFTKYDV